MNVQRDPAQESAVAGDTGALLNSAVLAELQRGY